MYNLAYDGEVKAIGLIFVGLNDYPVHKVPWGCCIFISTPTCLHVWCVTRIQYKCPIWQACIYWIVWLKPQNPNPTRWCLRGRVFFGEVQLNLYAIGCLSWKTMEQLNKSVLLFFFFSSLICLLGFLTKSYT